jgi:glycosyltransferase involved in cell wall biosynthesis
MRIMALLTILPLPYNGTGVSYTCGSLAVAMADSGLASEIVTPVARKPIGHGVAMSQSLDPFRRLLPWRLNIGQAQSSLEQYVWKRVRGHKNPGAIYIWPDISLELIERLKDFGHTLIREMTNCHRGTAKKILDLEYTKLGSAPLHSISAESVKRETVALARMDHIFCPNAQVVRSVEMHDEMIAGRLLPTSYGWEPKRIFSEKRLLPPIEGVTILFAGYISVGKGAHLLLDAWTRSGIKGRLILAGRLEPFLAARCKAQLSRDDVIVTGYVEDIGALYRCADIFAFPTLTEGGPMVTFEAQGAGLPVLTTPMGEAGIVVDGETGFVVEPDDDGAMLSRLVELANSIGLRRDMGEAARTAAQNFTWTQVGARRAAQLHKVLGRV